MGITQQEIEAFHQAKAAEKVAEVLELDREDTSVFLNKTKALTLEFMDSFHDALLEMDPHTAESARDHFQSDLSLYLPHDRDQFTQCHFLFPMALFPIVGRYSAQERIPNAPQHIYSAIRRSSRIEENSDEVRALVARGALTQSCISGSYIDWERDDTQWDDDVLTRRLMWFAHNSEVLAPLVSVLRERVTEGLLDFELCREIVSSAREGAAPALMAGAL